MSLGLSRAYLGLLHGRPSVLNASSSHLVSHSSGLCRRSKVLTRTYAGGSASATKIKGPPTAKSTVKHLGMGSVATPKVNAKTSARTTPKTTSAPAKAAAVTVGAPHPATPALSTGAAITPGAAIATNAATYIAHTDVPTTEAPKEKAEEKAEDADEEERIKQIEDLLLMSRQMRTMDPFGLPIEQILDVMIPYPASITAWNQYDSFKAFRKQFFKNRMNEVKNAVTMMLLASKDSIPGQDLSEAKLTEKLFKWPFRIFTTQSVKPNAWLEPFRGLALNSYKQLNTAIAKQEENVARQLTTGDHRKDSMNLIKKNKDSHFKYVWRFHKEVNPTRVLSLRAMDGYLGKAEPLIGNRLFVQALVKFDTLQSLEIYNKLGNALHTPANQAQKSKSGTVAAKPKRVTEYFIMEKRMWYDDPWVFKKQMWELPRKNTKKVPSM